MNLNSTKQKPQRSEKGKQMQRYDSLLHAHAQRCKNKMANSAKEANTIQLVNKAVLKNHTFLNIELMVDSILF